MKKFLEYNVISHNLMSFTGFKSILIFTMLVDRPMSYTDIQEALYENEYLREIVSIDTIRIYLNTLMSLGCHLKRRVKSGITYFSIDKHPFELNISNAQAKSIIKLYKAICKSISLSDLMVLHSFFTKMAPYISKSDKLRKRFENLSPTSNIKEQMIYDLTAAIENNTEITIYYNAPRTGKKYINIVPDKLIVLDSRLYVCGISKEYDNYARFMVNKIIEITDVKTKNPNDDASLYSVMYEITGVLPELSNEETVLKQDNQTAIVRMTSKNKFDIIQRVLFYSNQCKVLYPESFKNEIVQCLNNMRKIYTDE